MIFKRKNISSLHLPHNKNTAECTPVRINAPKEVLLPMDMHSGHVAEPIVAVGDYVKVGQLIAREEGRFSSPVHATVSGKVVAIEKILRPSGKEVQVIRIENDGLMTVDSAALTNTVSTVYCSLRISFNFAHVGNAAPPKPTHPLSLTACKNSSGLV